MDMPGSRPQVRSGKFFHRYLLEAVERLRIESIEPVSPVLMERVGADLAEYSRIRRLFIKMDGGVESAGPDPLPRVGA